MLGPVVLVAEDDPGLRSLIARALDDEGIPCVAVATGTELLERAADVTAGAMIVDIGLPDSDGRDVCQALRARGDNTPVLFLTARDALVDRLSGFGAGGDDYLVKPCSFDELIARVRALLRRSGAPASPSIAGVHLDPAAHALCAGDARVSLTPTEFRVLAALWAHPGDAVRRRDLVRAGWPAGAIVNDNTLDAYVVRLRRKLRQIPSGPALTTVHGVGYMVR